MISIDFCERSEELRIEMIPKGSGSENGSFLKMCIPAEGVDAIKTFVVDKVIEVGGRVCPPTIVGVGLGGTSDLCAHLAKMAAGPEPRYGQAGGVVRAHDNIHGARPHQEKLATSIALLGDDVS